MCSDFRCAASVARMATSVFQCSASTSGGFPALLSMSWFSLHRVLMRTFVIIGLIHFSHTFSVCPHISQSVCQVVHTSHPHSSPSQHYTQHSCVHTTVEKPMQYTSTRKRPNGCLQRRHGVSVHMSRQTPTPPPTLQ